MSSRAARALPLLAVFAGLTALYLVEALLHHSPWIFFDELDYSLNARQIADLGTQPGAKPYHFEGFYPFLIAPAWLASSVHAAYAVSKAIGALTMATVVFPAYWLARTLAASRPVALFAAAATAAVPAMSYSSSLMTETVAYPYATLCFLLIVKGLSSRSRGWWLAGAATASAVAPLIRKELAVIPAAFAVAALAFFSIPWLGRSRRRWAAAALVAAGTLVLLAWALTFASTTWSEAVPHPLKMIAYARSGAASVAVGVAILPAIAGLAVLVRPRGDRSTPARFAFGCLFVPAATGFLLYTAAKGVYFGPLANPVEERNLIYLVPLLFAGTAVWLTRRRVEVAAVLGAAALVIWLVATVPLHLGPVPASDAPSLEVLHSLGWGSPGLHGLLVGAAVASLLVTLWRPTWLAASVLCLLVLAWTLSSEVYASKRSADYASVLASSIPRPLDWITRATHGAPSLYVGQEILQPTDVWLLSFWNPSLARMRSLDRTPLLPRFRGIGSTGDILRGFVQPDGRLLDTRGLDFLVADRGITGAGPQIAQSKRWRVYAGTSLHSAALGVYSDGWMGSRSTFTVFNGAPAAVRIRLSRAAWCGQDVPGNARISVNGSLRKRLVVHACRTVEATLPAPAPPVRVVVAIEPTFSPAKLDPAHSTDTRELGAQVTYSASAK